MEWKSLIGWGLILIMLGSASCKPDPSPEEQLDNVSDDFLAFYKRFHDDSIYQMAHVIFPLQSQPAIEPDSAYSGYIEAKDYHIQHVPVEGDFIREIRQVSETMVEEMLYHKEYKIGFQRRFAKLDDDWYLIYYSGRKPISWE